MKTFPHEINSNDTYALNSVVLTAIPQPAEKHYLRTYPRNNTTDK